MDPLQEAYLTLDILSTSPEQKRQEFQRLSHSHARQKLSAASALLYRREMKNNASKVTSSRGLVRESNASKKESAQSHLKKAAEKGNAFSIGTIYQQNIENPKEETISGKRSYD